jgi:hypothetical protein
MVVGEEPSAAALTDGPRPAKLRVEMHVEFRVLGR